MGAANPQASVEDAKWMAAQIKASLGAMTQDQYERYVKSGVGTREMVTSEAGLVADAMAELYAADLRDDLARIESPALVLGTWIGFRQYTDHARVEANLRAQYAKLRGARIELTDAARHFIMLDDPEWMFKLMDELLASPEKGKKGIPLDAAGLLVSWCGTSAAASSSLINS
jgi:pimeloyl-ACP methyl ester carboxylesterase